MENQNKENLHDQETPRNEHGESHNEEAEGGGNTSGGKENGRHESGDQRNQETADSEAGEQESGEEERGESVCIPADPEERADELINWASVRAGVITLVPGGGALALAGNQVYMVVRIGQVYGAEISASAAKGFILGMGATLAGQTLAHLIPGINIVIAFSVTYGIGKAAKAWIEDGLPPDLGRYRTICDEMKEEGTREAKL